jgi:hypothetical protein
MCKKFFVYKEKSLVGLTLGVDFINIVFLTKFFEQTESEAFLGKRHLANGRGV